MKKRFSTVCFEPNTGTYLYEDTDNDGHRENKACISIKSCYVKTDASENNGNLLIEIPVHAMDVLATAWSHREEENIT